jgi:hypothetical protein
MQDPSFPDPEHAGPGNAPQQRLMIARLATTTTRGLQVLPDGEPSSNCGVTIDLI